MRVSDIVRAIEEFAPASIQESWDNTGLQLGSPGQEVSGVLLALDCTAELVEEAVRRGCNMIVTHHPLIFHPLSRIDPDNPVGAAVIAAIRSGVAVYSAHTSADKVPDGVSGAMAARLGLLNVRILCEEAPGVGLGAVGELPEELSVSEAVALVKRVFGLSCLRTSAPIEGKIRTVAVCGGSGSSLIGDALASGAQLYLCGDISYHHFFVPEGFMLADVGHFESEVQIVEILHSVIRKNFPNFVSLVSESIGEANPVNYL